jgi:hypothetical protein
MIIKLKKRPGPTGAAEPVTKKLTANVFLPGGSGTTITHNTQIKHSTQTYTNNKGHTTHKEYNANAITTTII